MHSSTTSAVLLTSLVSVASAFVPMQFAPLPTDLDTNVWVPYTTLPAEPAPTAASLSPQPVPTDASEHISEILSFAAPTMAAELKRRQGVAQAVPPVVTQVSPITTYEIDLNRNGVATRLVVVYTQTFNPIPDQWPLPTQAGTIGLGTIQGEIGVVKTKRSLPTQAPLAPSPDPTPSEKAPEDESSTLMDKLRKAGKEVQDEVEELLNKVKKPASDGSNTLMDKLRKAGKQIQDEVEELLNKVRKPVSEKGQGTSLPLGKEFRVSASGSSASKVPIPFGSPSNTDAPFSFGGSEGPSEPFSFGGGDSENDKETPSDIFSFGDGDSESDKEEVHLRPEARVHENDSRVLKAGSLAIIAVTVGTLCVNYL